MLNRFDNMVFKGFPDNSIKNQVLCILRRIGFELDRNTMIFDTDENNMSRLNYLVVNSTTGKYEFMTKEVYEDVFDDECFTTLSLYSLIDVCKYLEVPYLIDVKELEIRKLVENNKYLPLHNKMCGLSNMMNKLTTGNEHLLYGVLIAKYGTLGKVIYNTVTQIVYKFSSFTPLTSYEQTDNFLLTLSHYYLNNFNSFIWDKFEEAEPARWQNSNPEVVYKENHEYEDGEYIDDEIINDEYLKCLACILTGKDISYFNDTIVQYVVTHLTETIDYLNRTDI